LSNGDNVVPELEALMHKQTSEIRIMRELLHMKQEKLAAIVGCSSRTINRVEDGSYAHSRAAHRVVKVLFDLLQQGDAR
jgi:DNA-binding XRE family transcriptional regulator